MRALMPGMVDDLVSPTSFLLQDCYCWKCSKSVGISRKIAGFPWFSSHSAELSGLSTLHSLIHLKDISQPVCFLPLDAQTRGPQK